MIALLSRGIPDKLMPFVVTVVRAGTTTDRYGNEVRDWTNATRVTTKAWIEQRVYATTTGENNTDRAELASSWLLIVPLGVDIGGHDRVEYNGETYEVTGPPSIVHTMRGPHHVEAQLSWVSG